jgi:hypothetical protein
MRATALHNGSQTILKIRLSAAVCEEPEVELIPGTQHWPQDC